MPGDASAAGISYNLAERTARRAPVAPGILVGSPASVSWAINANAIASLASGIDAAASVAVTAMPGSRTASIRNQRGVAGATGR